MALLTEKAARKTIRRNNNNTNNRNRNLLRKHGRATNSSVSHMRETERTAEDTHLTHTHKPKRETAAAPPLVTL